MTKTQKIIVLAAAVLIVAAVLFPPYWDYIIDKQGHITGARTKWEFNRQLASIIDDISSGNWMFAWYEIPVRRGLFTIEILGILVLAGAGLLITKKRS
jgi:hypothetical protein